MCVCVCVCVCVYTGGVVSTHYGYLGVPSVHSPCLAGWFITKGEPCVVGCLGDNILIDDDGLHIQ